MREITLRLTRPNNKSFGTGRHPNVSGRSTCFRLQDNLRVTGRPVSDIHTHASTGTDKMTQTDFFFAACTSRDRSPMFWSHVSAPSPHLWVSRDDVIDSLPYNAGNDTFHIRTSQQRCGRRQRDSPNVFRRPSMKVIRATVVGRS